MRRWLPALLCLVLLFSLFSPLQGNLPRALAVVEDDPPVTNHTIIGHQAPNGIYYGTVEIQLSASDVGSGVSTTQYSLDGGANWTIYNQSIVFSVKQVYEVLYRSIDNNNNIESPKSVTFTIKQDTYGPNTTVEITGTQGQNSYYISPVTVALHATDTQSGVEYSEYSLDAHKLGFRISIQFN